MKKKKFKLYKTTGYSPIMAAFGTKKIDSKLPNMYSNPVVINNKKVKSNTSRKRNKRQEYTYDQGNTQITKS